MSRTMAEAQLPKRVDAVKLVEINQQFNAEIDGNSLLRLKDAVVHCTAVVKVEVTFDRDQEANRVISGRCATEVEMVCQRCLGSVVVPVESQFELGLVFNDDQAKQLPKRLEPVEMNEDGLLELWDVIEDELLLELPAFPTHSDGECQLKQPEPETTIATDVERENPFSVLAKLKQQ